MLMTALDTWVALPLCFLSHRALGMLFCFAHNNQNHGDDVPHLLSRRFYGSQNGQSGSFGYTLTCSKALLGGDGVCYFGSLWACALFYFFLPSGLRASADVAHIAMLVWLCTLSELGRR